MDAGDRTHLDALDRRILHVLQRDGRSTYEQIAETVGLSPSAVLRRVRKLEEAGIIQGYVALLRTEPLGLGLTAYLNVRLSRQPDAQRRDPMELFCSAIQHWPEVVECASLTGDMDYLLRVVVADMAHYNRFVMHTLLKHPSVLDCKTSFVMGWVKQTTVLPVLAGK